MTYKVIESNNNEIIKHTHKLIHNHIYCKQNKLFAIEKYKLCEELVKNGFNVKTVLIVKDYLDELVPKLHALGIKDSQIIVINQKIAEYLSDNVSANHLFAIAEYKINIETKISKNKNILFLDQIQDPGNLGNMIRTGFGLGIDYIILNNCVSPFNAKVIKASMGGSFKSNIISITDPKSYLSALKDMDYKVICSTLQTNSVDLKSAKLKTKANVLVIGNEGHGISDTVLAYSDLNIKIKMHHQIESLNAASACSILCYWLLNN